MSSFAHLILADPRAQTRLVGVLLLALMIPMKTYLRRHTKHGYSRRVPGMKRRIYQRSNATLNHWRLFEVHQHKHLHLQFQ